MNLHINESLLKKLDAARGTQSRAAFIVSQLDNILTRPIREDNNEETGTRSYPTSGMVNAEQVNTTSEATKE